MDRFKIYTIFKTWIEHTNKFGITRVNIFQALLSPIMINLCLCEANKALRYKKETNFFRQSILEVKWFIDSVKFSKQKLIYGNNEIIFIAVEPTHVKQFINIWKTLVNSNISFTIVTNRKNIYEKFKHQYSVFFLPFDRSIVRKEYPNLKKQIASAFQDPIFQKLELNHDVIKLTTSKHTLRFFILQKQFEIFFSKYKPKALFVGNDLTMEGRISTLLAKQMGIKTYCVMHGSVTGEPLHSYHQVDTFFTYGLVAKEDLIKQGMSERRLFVSGAPYLDDYCLDSTSINPQILNGLQLNLDKPYILVALSGPGNSTSFKHFEETILSILSLAEKFKDYNWVIKLHRKDKIENFKESLLNFPNTPVNIIDNFKQSELPSSIFDWLAGANCLITGNSTVAIEAMLLNIPVITIDLLNEFKNVDFIDLGCSFHVTKSNDLENVFLNIMRENKDLFQINKVKEYVSKYFYKSEMPASLIIVDKIRSDIF